MKPLKILVVDDDFSNAYVTGQLFEILGHDVHIVNSGSAALQFVKYSRLDLVMVDISMPDINGYELCRKLRKTKGCEAACIVAQSGWENDDSEKTEDSGFDNYLVKPVALDTIQSLLMSMETVPVTQRSAQSGLLMRWA